MELPKSIEVNVTQEDINESKVRIAQRKPAENCPIAIAMTRVFKSPVVIQDYAYLYVNILSVYKLPTEAKVFISEFDQGLLPSPFTFTAEFYK